jgi:mRNA-degrading endonuclease toxin of MazEF toxin-antitoxin module
MPRFGSFCEPSGSAKWELTWPLARRQQRMRRGSAHQTRRSPVRSGDLLMVDFGHPVGSTPALIRPSIVITADQTLRHYSATMHVVPVTSNVGRALRTDIDLRDADLPVHSVAQCHLCAVIDASQVTSEMGSNVGAVLVAQIRSVLSDLLDIP